MPLFGAAARIAPHRVRIAITNASVTSCAVSCAQQPTTRRENADSRIPLYRMVSGLHAERIENRCSINGRFEFSLSRYPRLILRKVRRFGSRKTTQYQELTSPY
jgi:hypothetical protein